MYLFGGKYYVQEISYNNYTIRMVDSSIRKDNYFSFSTPTYSLYQYNFSSDDPYTTYQQKKTVSEWYPELSRSLVWMSCEKLVNSPYYLDTSTCIHNSSNYSDIRNNSVWRSNCHRVYQSLQPWLCSYCNWFPANKCNTVRLFSHDSSYLGSPQLSGSLFNRKGKLMLGILPQEEGGQ